MSRDDRCDATVAKAVAILASLEIRHLPVVNANGVLVGIISDRDVYGEVAADAPASTVMSVSVHAAPLNADMKTIAKLMVDFKIGAVPIVGIDDKLVGIVSYVDILRSLV